ncbi:MAG: family 43 glycosylhydrolase [Clostridia bacterium]|nr:family 43 glycosylhydrolase [Clostridia bacterium]
MNKEYIKNPILRGDYSDPDVIRVGDKYYMITSTFQLYPGMAILESRDLVNWKTVNYAVPDIDLLEPNMAYDKMECYNVGIYAGAIRYLRWNERSHDGKLTPRSKWFMYTTIYRRGIIVSTADDVYGKWTSRFMKDKNGLDIVAPTWDDNCPYWEFNDDGTLRAAYMIASKPGGPWWYTKVFEMSLDGMTLLDGDVRFMALPGDPTRVRTGKTPELDIYEGSNSGDAVEGDIINRFTGEVIPTSRHITENHVIRMNSWGDIESVLCAEHIKGREGTVINDTPSAEASKIIRFGEDTEIGRTYFKGRHGERERVSDYVYIFSSEWWDGFRFPILRRAKSVYGDLFDENEVCIGAGSAGNPGCFETQRLNLNLFDSVDTREPNQGGYVDIPASMSTDGREHWYFITHHGKQDVYADCRPTSLLPVTWIDGWPLFGKLPENEVYTTGEADVLATQYDGTGLTSDADPTRHHPHARLIPGVMQWEIEKPPVKCEPRREKYQDSDNFGSGLYGGDCNSTTERLSPNWQFNHAPRRTHYSLSEREGYLRLYAFRTVDGSEDFFKIGNVICQRYLTFDEVLAECLIDVSCMKAGQEAGIAHFNGGVSFSSLGVRMGPSGQKFMVSSLAEISETVDSDEIILRTTVKLDELKVHFFYSTDGGKSFTEFGSGYVPCTGNYRGDYIGIYTYNNTVSAECDKHDGGYVDVDYFRYEYK